MRVCTKRIIACLDVKQGKVVKGIKFQNLRIMGDPVKLAAMYEEEGADEIVFLTFRLRLREEVFC
jgi:imidazole glycerol phosphate synthase subunit hisF (EC 4.1.3.-)